MKRTPDDIKRAFETQRRALAASCDAYDQGTKWEVLRLATTVCTLVFDGKHSHSVLFHARIKDNLTFVATGRRVTEQLMNNFHRSTRLVELSTEKGNSSFIPLCTYYQSRGDEFPVRFLSFKEWWDEDVIYFDREHLGQPTAWLRARPERTSKEEEALYQPKQYSLWGARTTLTRKDLVRSMRDQDGGSHYDGELTNDNYKSLIEPVYLFKRPKLNVCVDLELATMRQVAEELRLTFQAHGLQNYGDLLHLEMRQIRSGEWPKRKSHILTEAV